MKRIIVCAVIASFSFSPVSADSSLIYFFLSGVAFATGAVCADNVNELRTKSATYHSIGIDNQIKSDESARLSGEFQAYAEIAYFLNDFTLMSDATSQSRQYASQSEHYRSESAHYFAESSSYSKEAVHYEWYSGTAYTAGVLLFSKGLWDLFKKDTPPSQQKSFWIETRLTPAKNEILLKKVF